MGRSKMVKRKLSSTEDVQPTKRRKKTEGNVAPTTSKPKATQRGKTSKSRAATRKKTVSARKTTKNIKSEVKDEPTKSPKKNTSAKPKSPKKTTGNIKSEIKEEPINSPKKSPAARAKSPKRQSSKYSARENKFIGAHVSIAGHLSNAVREAVELEARAFGMFLKSQRQWASKPLDDKVAQEFKASCKEHGFLPKYIVPHGSYLMNCASPKEESLQKSRAMLVDELQRCEKLGLEIFNFHPGSTCGEITLEEGIKKIATSINQAHKKTKYVTAVLENMCCQGHTIGGRFEELAAIIKQVTDKSRVGVCLDTCHAYAAGFNLKTEEGYESMMSDFEKIVGLKYLKAVHVNDSKGDVGCHQDRHETIGRGKIGLEGFRRIMNDPRFDDIPFVLETPEGDYAKEIRSLYRLCSS